MMIMIIKNSSSNFVVYAVMSSLLKCFLSCYSIIIISIIISVVVNDVHYALQLAILMTDNLVLSIQT